MQKISFIALLLFTPLIIFCQNNECQEYEDMAMDYYDKQEFKKALHYFERLVKCSPEFDNYYNSACAASQAGNKNAGFKYLKKAILYGFADTVFMNSDNDLTNLQHDKRWQQASKWVLEIKDYITTEVSNIKFNYHYCYFIPYKVGDKWGYLDKLTKQKITAPIFNNISFIEEYGRVRYGEWDIKFNNKGVIIEMDIAKFDFDGLTIDHCPYYLPDPKLDAGFSIKNNEIVSYSYIYNSLRQLTINQKNIYAIAEQNGKFSLIDSSGYYIHNLNNYSYISFCDYGINSESAINDSDGDFLFFYKDTNNIMGFIDNHFNSTILKNCTEYARSIGGGFMGAYLDEISEYVYLKKLGKWGVWSCRNRKWIINPEYDSIFKTEVINLSNLNCNNNGKTWELYFLVLLGNKEFFVDSENNRYILK